MLLSPAFWKITIDQQHIQTREFCLLFKKSEWCKTLQSLVWHLFSWLSFQWKWGHTYYCHGSWDSHHLSVQCILLPPDFPLLLKYVEVNENPRCSVRCASTSQESLAGRRAPDFLLTPPFTPSQQKLMTGLFFIKMQILHTTSTKDQWLAFG